VAQEAVRIGTSSVGSTMYTIGVGMSKIIQKHGGLNVSVESLGGSHANMFGVARGKVEFAMGNSGATFDRYQGNKPFKKPFELRLVAQGNPNYRGIFVTASSGINTPEGLVGKTIMGKRKPLPELEKLLNAVIKVYGLPKNKIKVVSSRNLGEVNRMLRAGSVAAAAYPFSERQPVISKLFHDGIVKPLIFAEDKYDAMKKLLPDMFYKYHFPANTWKNQPKAFFTFGLSTHLVTGVKQSADTVYKVTKALLGNTKEFSKYHGSARHWNIKKTLSKPTVPFHEGSVRYFKEIGVWTPKLAAAQAKLLSRK
jgi:TRAP transporter TAXI family solute receptor